MSFEELLGILDPAPERRDEAESLLRMLTARHFYDAVAQVSNPPTPRAVARRARRVAELAEQLAGEVEALSLDLLPLLMRPETNHSWGWEQRAHSERLRALAADAARIAEAAEGEHAAPGRRVVRHARHYAIRHLETQFRHFHRSEYHPEDLQWKAERNRFLHAGLALIGLDCERRTLEQHLRKLVEDAAAVPVGVVS